MNDVKVVIIAATGALIGGCVVHNYMAKKYNVLVGEYNRLVAYDRIKSRVFAEIMPQLPDDYTLSEQTMTDIQAANMFINNDL